MAPPNETGSQAHTRQHRDGADISDPSANTPPASNSTFPITVSTPQRQRQRSDGQSSQRYGYGYGQGHDHEDHRHGNIESWVEVSSHPSSSSVSSIGDDIVTTGLRVGPNAFARRRRLHPQSYNHLLAQQQQQQQLQHQQRQRQASAYLSSQSSQAGTGSQEEYDESETDSDHVLTSSTENVTSIPNLSPTPLRNVVQPADSESSEDEDDDDDENATALGSRRPSEPFRPQPNAFSHPPSHLHRHSTSSGVPHHQPRPSFSQRSNTRIDRRSPNFVSPDYQADNDAALRASLTTLLSCAAAARSRSKDGEKELAEHTSPGGGSQPTSLRLVPESELMDPTPRPTAQGRVLRADPVTSPTTPSRNTVPSPDKIKRAATPTPPAKSPRATKKKTASSSGAEETFISPTLMTWVVSAGVVVLVSVVGFGAGYVIGREVGRQESLGSLSATNASSVVDGGSCGREVIRSSGGTLRRFRWGGGMGKGIVA